MSSVFTLLDEIKKRPGMYLAGDPDRRQQLFSLASLLAGYGFATNAHNVVDPGRTFVRDFAEHLYRKYGWRDNLGPIDLIRHKSSSDDEAWERFWILVQEFKEARALTAPS